MFRRGTWFGSPRVRKVPRSSRVGDGGGGDRVDPPGEALADRQQGDEVGVRGVGGGCGEGVERGGELLVRVSEGVAGHTWIIYEHMFDIERIVAAQGPFGARSGWRLPGRRVVRGTAEFVGRSGGGPRPTCPARRVVRQWMRRPVVPKRHPHGPTRPAPHCLGSCPVVGRTPAPAAARGVRPPTLSTAPPDSPDSPGGGGRCEIPIHPPPPIPPVRSQP